jgi:hypothetical protein
MPRPAAPQEPSQIRHALRAAHDAVDHLARERKQNLPRGIGSASAARPGPCPTRIGRICHWAEDENAPAPPPDAPAVVRARELAIRLLDSAARVRPVDDWVAGQRVRLLVDAGNLTAAVAAARDCRGAPAWCAELAGYALHNAGAYASADSAFAAALDYMSPDERCRWRDIGPLLDGALAARYERSSCSGRDSLARQIWWLAAPLYLESTADARTEYYARRTRARMADDEPASSLFGWDDDARRTALRYGWSTWYSQDRPNPGAILEPAIVGHERGGSYYFLPSARALDSLGWTDSTDWELTGDGARTAYAPAYARTLHALPVRISRLRRGDSLAVIAHWDARGDTTLSGAGLVAGVFLGTGPGHMWSRRAQSAPTVGAIALIAASEPLLASVELLDTTRHRAARARHGVKPLPTGAFAISDIILLRAPPADARPSADALAALATGTDVDSSALAYYELYTPPGFSGNVSMELRVLPERAGWARRLAQRLHLAQAPSAIALHWTEHARADGRTSRALHLDLSRLAAGSYRIEIGARDPRGTLVTRAVAELRVAAPL